MLFSLFLLFLGLFVGSFLNVLSDRLPRNETVVKGRSHCEYCKKELQWYDLIPLFSFIFLKGKCRYCHKKLSFSYPISELGTGLIFFITSLFVLNGPIYTYDIVIKLIFYLFMVSSLIAIFFADLKHGIIPDKIIFPAILINLLYLLLFNNHFLIQNFLSGLGALLFFLLLVLVTRGRGMGLGDVKFSFLIGLFLGFPGVLIGLYLAFLTGALISIILILWRKKFLKDSIPFGPFLVLGTFIGLYFGNLLYEKLLLLMGF